MLQSMGSQRVGYNLMTEEEQQESQPSRFSSQGLPWWLRLGPSTAGGADLILGFGTNIRCAPQRNNNNNKKLKSINVAKFVSQERRSYHL